MTSSPCVSSFLTITVCLSLFHVASPTMLTSMWIITKINKKAIIQRHFPRYFLSPNNRSGVYPISGYIYISHATNETWKFTKKKITTEINKVFFELCIADYNKYITSEWPQKILDFPPNHMFKNFTVNLEN